MDTIEFVAALWKEESKNYCICAYEVFQVQKIAKRHINGRVLEAREVTPSNEQRERRVKKNQPQMRPPL